MKNRYSAEKVLVTGGGGFIGSALVRALVERGREVRILGRRRYPHLPPAVEQVRGDIADPAVVHQALTGVETVFHVAARAGVWGPRDDFFRVNVQGTVNVIRGCLARGVARLIHTSSPSVVFSGRDLEGVDESHPYARPSLCHYATSKIIAEQLVLQANGPHLRTCAIRPHLVWGPGDPHLVPRLIERAQAGRLRRVGSGTNRVDITYIDNAVAAHLLAAANLQGKGSAAGQSFFIGQERAVSLWSWIDSLLQGCGLEPVCRSIPYPLARMVGAACELAWFLAASSQEPPMTRFVAAQLARSHWFSHARAERLLGYRPRISLDEGMARLLASLTPRR